MTQNPYAQFGQPQAGRGGMGGFGGEFIEPLNSRTSVLAVLALIAGLVCFLPGTGVLALIFGGAAVIVIGRSQGRLRGMGLAITGIVLGLLFSIVWVMIVMGLVSGAQFFTRELIAPVGNVVSAIESGDRTKARSMFTVASNSAITDQQLDDFAAALKKEWGAVQSSPTSLRELIAGYTEVGPRMESMSGQQNVIPVPIRFEKGVTVITLAVEQRNVQMPPGSASHIPVNNIGFFAKDGSIVWVSGPPDPPVVRHGPPPSPAPAESTSPPKPDDAAEPPVPPR